MTNEKLLEGIARAIYLKRYADIGGKWEAVETKEVWHEDAQAVIDHLAPMMQQIAEVLLINHTQNALCYGKEYTDTVLWSKTEAALSSLPDCWKGGV